METINIVNNFDLKIIMENMLITNQSKLLELIINEFEFGYLSNKDLVLDKQNVSEHLNKKKFINWNLFLNLINLNTTCYSQKTKLKTNSLNYIISSKSTRLIEFLLDLTLKNYSSGETKLVEEEQINWSGVFVNIIRQMYANDTIINKLIDLVLVDNQYRDLLNEKIHKDKTTLFYLVSKCSETIILRLVETNLIQWNWEDDYANGLVHWACKRNLTQLLDLVIKNNLNLDKTNKGGKTPLHLACIKNNIGIVKLLIDNKVDMEIIDLESNAPINYAVKYGKSELVKLLLDQDISLGLNSGDIFYQIIKYQNRELVSYFIDTNLVDINKTNWIWTTILFGTKSMYSQFFQYSSKKIHTTIVDYIINMHKYYNGRYIGDIFDDDDTNFYRF